MLEIDENQVASWRQYMAKEQGQGQIPIYSANIYQTSSNGSLELDRNYYSSLLHKSRMEHCRVNCNGDSGPLQLGGKQSYSIGPLLISEK